MKVLWFSNSPVSAGKVKNISFTGGSWIQALEKSFRARPDVNLGIVCQMRTTKIEEHSIDGVNYFICPVTSGFIKRKIGWGGNFKTNDEIALTYYLKIIEDFNPDIIHIFGSENNYGLIIPHIKTPVIIHIQGFIGMYVKKYFSGIPYFNLLRLTPIHKIVKGVTEINYFNFFKRLEQRERIIFSHTKYFFGRTRWDYHITRAIAPKSTYFHCEEMLREEFGNHRWVQRNENCLIITSIISPSFYKGFDLVFETAVMLYSLNIDFKWNIIGCSADEEIIRVIEKLYRKKFPENVKLLGNKGTEEIISYLLSSDLFVHPSYIDNSPNSVCEAMMLGMPVIVVATGGCPSIVEDNQDGILVNSGDPYDLTGAITELVKDPQKAKLLGDNARMRAIKRHEPEQIIETIIQTYQKIIHESIA